MKVSDCKSLLELAALVAGHLNENGINAVLTGGSVVSIYSQNRYQSQDLDFISAASIGDIDLAMKQLGFAKTGKDFTHPDTEYFVEFPTGPLAVGSMIIKGDATITVGDKTLRLLSPTECIMDRLAAYYFWNDTQSLNQAVLVAVNHPFNSDTVRRWSNTEGYTEKYRRFLALTKK